MKYFTLSQQYSIAGIAGCLLVLLAVRHVSQTGLFGRTISSVSVVENARPVAVEIVGEVKAPGIYSFANAVQVSQVIEEAGGLKENLVLHVLISPPFDWLI